MPVRPRTGALSLDRMDDRWSRPPGTRGCGEAIGTVLSRVGRAPCSIRRVKPLRNYPLVWRKGVGGRAALDAISLLAGR